MKTLNKNGSIKIDELIEPSIELDKKLSKIIINNLDLNNKDLFNLLDEKPNDETRVSELKDIVDIGTFVKNKVQMVQETDYFDRRISEMVHDFSLGIDNVKGEMLKVVNEKFDPNTANSYTDQINQFFEKKKNEFLREAKDSIKELDNNRVEISKNIDDSFNPEKRTSHISKLMEFINEFNINLSNEFDLNREGSISHDLKKLITQTLSKDGELVKSINKKFSFDNPESTITVLQNNLIQKMDEIMNELVAGRRAIETEEEMAEKSPQKGFDFEDMLFEKLEEFACRNGDIVEDTSNAIGEVTRSKKGDFLYHINKLNKKIAIEAKNKEMGSPKKLLETLDKTKINRNADYVIYISALENQLHNQVGLFQEYLPDKIVTHFGLWEIALKIAISRIMIESSEVEGVDRNAIEKEIINIQQSIKTVSNIKTAATNIESQSQKIKNQIDQIKVEILDAAGNISELIKEPNKID